MRADTRGLCFRLRRSPDYLPNHIQLSKTPLRLRATSMLTGWEPSLSEGLQKFSGWKGHALLRVSALKWASAPSAFWKLKCDWGCYAFFSFGVFSCGASLPRPAPWRSEHAETKWSRTEGRKGGDAKTERVSNEGVIRIPIRFASFAPGRMWLCVTSVWMRVSIDSLVLSEVAVSSLLLFKWEL